MFVKIFIICFYFCYYQKIKKIRRMRMYRFRRSFIWEQFGVLGFVTIGRIFRVWRRASRIY